MERTFDRLYNQMRALDKLLWNYCSKNIESEKYPLWSFSNLEEDISDFNRLFWEFQASVKEEGVRVKKLHEQKHPPDHKESKEDDVDALVMSCLTKLDVNKKL